MENLSNVIKELIEGFKSFGLTCVLEFRSNVPDSYCRIDSFKKKKSKKKTNKTTHFEDVRYTITLYKDGEELGSIRANNQMWEVSGVCEYTWSEKGLNDFKEFALNEFGSED